MAVVKKTIAGFILVLISGFSMAQQKESKSKVKAAADAAWARAGCGADDVHFNVTMDKNQHPLAQPESGKALVYIFEDDLTNGALPTTRTGLDGKWIGGNVPGSYLFFPVTPGVHRLCSNWQGWPKTGAALDFTAEAGKVYFFRATITSFGSEVFALEPVAEAEGHFLVASHGLSASAEKGGNGDK
jgi:hypothetical protein